MVYNVLNRMDIEGYDSIFLTKLEETLDTEMDFELRPKNVCIICSDESIVAGFLVSDVANECSNVPTTVTTDTRIPGWLDEDSLVILMMQSTMKDELRTVVGKLKYTGCKIVAISDRDTSDIDDILFNLRVGAEHKFEYLGEILGYLFMLFDKMKIIPKKEVKELIPTLLDKRNDAMKKLKEYNMSYYSKKNIFISYPPNFRSTAGLWQTLFFRRLRVATYISEYPEYDHNEIVGWCMSPDQSKYFVDVFIVDENTTDLLKVITGSLIDVLAESGVEIIKVRINGKNCLEKNLLGFLIGEAVPKPGVRKE